MDRSEEHLKANTERWLTKHSSSIAHSLEPPPSQSQKENGDSPRSRETGNARRLRLPRRLPLEHSGHLRQILGALHDAANTRAGKRRFSASLKGVSKVTADARQRRGDRSQLICSKPSRGTELCKTGGLFGTVAHHEETNAGRTDIPSGRLGAA